MKFTLHDPLMLPAAASRTAVRSTFVLLAAFSLFAISVAAQETRIPDAETLVGRPAAAPLDGEELRLTTEAVAAKIRCPVCQGLSVADSPSEMARNMKAQVSALLARGYTESQILDYFERSYGEFVRLEPKFEGVNRLVWILPAIALVGGIALIVVKMRRLEAAPGTTPEAGVAEAGPAVDDVPEQPDAPDPYLDRVRNLVKGDPS